jgi:coiled-coil domain-containing protein 130
MSSLAAARADNFYQPPEWDPQRESRNGFQARGKAKWQAHPLRERAKKLHTEGILVTRFEIPFDIWCSGCSSHIAKGVRFNADKTHAGKYLSSTIWAFRLKCPQCKRAIELRTDPRAGDFEVTEGARRKEEGYTEADAEVERIDAPEERARRAADPFRSLEHRTASEHRAHSAHHWMTELQSNREQRWASGNDYALSSTLRKRHREQKRDDRHAQLELRARGIGVIDRLPELTSAEEQLATQRSVDSAKRRRSAADCALPVARLRMGGIFDGTPGQGTLASETEKRLRVFHKRGLLGIKSRTH